MTTAIGVSVTLHLGQRSINLGLNSGWRNLSRALMNGACHCLKPGPTRRSPKGLVNGKTAKVLIFGIRDDHRNRLAFLLQNNRLLQISDSRPIRNFRLRHRFSVPFFFHHSRPVSPQAIPRETQALHSVYHAQTRQTTPLHPPQSASSAFHSSHKTRVRMGHTTADSGKQRIRQLPGRPLANCDAAAQRYALTPKRRNSPRTANQIRCFHESAVVRPLECLCVPIRLHPPHPHNPRSILPTNAGADGPHYSGFRETTDSATPRPASRQLRRSGTATRPDPKTAKLPRTANQIRCFHESAVVRPL